MKRSMRIALVTGVLALSAVPVALGAGKPEGVPPTTGNSNGPQYAPEEPPVGPKGGLPEKANAYGFYCKKASKKREQGEEEKGTPFSRCVTSMAKAATHPNMGAATVCRNESRKHVKGQKLTPFRECVTGVAKLRRHEREQQEGT